MMSYLIFRYSLFVGKRLWENNDFLCKITRCLFKNYLAAVWYAPFVTSAPEKWYCFPVDIGDLCRRFRLLCHSDFRVVAAMPAETQDRRLCQVSWCLALALMFYSVGVCSNGWEYNVKVWIGLYSTCAGSICVAYGVYAGLGRPTLLSEPFNYLPDQGT